MESMSAVEAISSFSDSLKTFSTDQVQSAPNQFAAMLTDGMQSVNTNISSAETAMNSYALDGNMPTHEVMLAMEKAKFSLQLAVEVRNRVVEAYSELTRMQI